MSTVRHLTPTPSTVSTFDTPSRTPLFRSSIIFNELAATPESLVLAYPLPLPKSETEASSRVRLGVDLLRACAMSLIFRSVAQCAAVGSNQGHSSYAARCSAAAYDERARQSFLRRSPVVRARSRRGVSDAQNYDPQ